MTSQTVQQTNEDAGNRKPPGLCFLCQKPGHWKNTCELAKGAVGSNNKLSIQCIDSNIVMASGNGEEESVNNRIAKVKAVESLSQVGRLKAAACKWREAGANE